MCWGGRVEITSRRCVYVCMCAHAHDIKRVIASHKKGRVRPAPVPPPSCMSLLSPLLPPSYSSQFLNSIENVIILEYFLALVIYSIKNQVAEISTFGETIGDIKRDINKKGNHTQSTMGQNPLLPG